MVPLGRQTGLSAEGMNIYAIDHQYDDTDDDDDDGDDDDDDGYYYYYDAGPNSLELSYTWASIQRAATIYSQMIIDLT